MARKPAPIKVVKVIFPEDGRVGPGWGYATQLLFIAAERAKAAEKSTDEEPRRFRNFFLSDTVHDSHV